MADATEADATLEEENGEEAKSGGSKKLIFIGAGAFVLLLIIAAAAYFFLFAGGDEDAAPEEAVVVAKPAFFYDLPELTVNLSSDGAGSENFLKLEVSLEVSDEAMLVPIGERVTRVMDAFQVYLRELRRSDLEGSAGIYRLKEELRRRVNLAVYPAEVDNILFREILVQ